MSRIRVVVLAALVGVLLSGCQLVKQPNEYVLPGGVATGSDGYGVQAEFANVENLVPNSRVMYNNVIIGTITRIKLGRDWQARVSMKLKKDVPLPSTVSFRIGQASLLGSEYVEVIDPPAGSLKNPPLLSEGDIATVARTGNYPETEDVLASVSLVLNGGGLAQLRTITSELNDMISAPARQQSARELIARTNVFLTSLDQNKRNILRLITAINRLAGTLAKQRKVVAKAIDHITPGLKSLNAERDTLVQALASLGRFGTVGARVINKSGDDLVANLRQVQPVLRGIEKASAAIPRALNVTGTFPFPLASIPIAVKGDYTNLFATIDLSLPQLTANFLGGPADISGVGQPSTAFQQFDPFLGPLGIDDPGTPIVGTKKQHVPAGKYARTPTKSSPATGTTPVPAPTPTASATPGQPTPCDLLTALLGGC